MSSLTFDQLKTGDILIFTAASDPTSQAILRLTNSTVSHAAIYDATKGSIIEATPPMVQYYSLSIPDERFRERTMYVNRLMQQPESMEPVINAATVYLNYETPYGQSNLYLLGLILLYKKLRPNSLVKQVMIKIYKKLILEIYEYISNKTSPGKSPMVCSDFIYKCFEDAGEPYKLKIKNGVLLNSTLSVTAEPLSPLDRVIERVKGSSYQSQPTLTSLADLTISQPPSENAQELGQELIEALCQTEVMSSEELEEELTFAIEEFAKATYLAEGTEDKAIPSLLAKTNELTSQFNISPYLSFLKAKEAFFVTPEDLLNNCENLMRVGSMVL
ncbi:MAG: hypothetical protein QNJ37_11205 [Crocosphaera sp.]|nr:hypothetical protein [Crocosphaera sp.]